MAIALAALKPAHLLYPAAGLCGRIVTADIGIQVETRCWRITKPRLSAPTFADHKYTRGFALVVEGAMPGAALPAARGRATVWRPAGKEWGSTCRSAWWP